MIRRTLLWIWISILLGFIGLGVGIFQFLSWREQHLTSTALLRLEKELSLAAQQRTTIELGPLVYSLGHLKTATYHLDPKQQTFLRHLIVKQAQLQAEAIEQSLYDRKYLRVFNDLKVLGEFLSLLGDDPAKIFPAYTCLKESYQDHPFLYPAENLDPAFRWIVPPPMHPCTQPEKAF